MVLLKTKRSEDYIYTFAATEDSDTVVIDKVKLTGEIVQSIGFRSYIVALAYWDALDMRKAA